MYGLRLPFRIGDTVWFIKAKFSYFAEPRSEKIKEIRLYLTDVNTTFKTKSRVFNDEDIGETVFLSKADAERRLREVKSER